MFYVYAYYEQNALEPFYIGKGTGDRAYVHLQSSSLNRQDTYFYRKLRKLLAQNSIPKIVILESNLSEAEAFALEMKLIAQYGRIDKGTGCLCNLTDGGDGVSGRILSDEAKKAIGQAQREVPSALGLTRSAAMRQQISQTLTGIKHTKERAAKTKLAIRAKYGKPVESYCLITGTVIKQYDSLGDAADDGYIKQAISQVVTGKRSSHAGLGWRYI